jgi:hypothetical protein
MIFHALTLEVMVFELALELNLCTTKAVEIENALFLNGWLLHPPISIIHRCYKLYITNI